jgi:hypothetical protein
MTICPFQRIQAFEEWLRSLRDELYRHEFYGVNSIHFAVDVEEELLPVDSSWAGGMLLRSAMSLRPCASPMHEIHAWDCPGLGIAVTNGDRWRWIGIIGCGEIAQYIGMHLIEPGLRVTICCDRRAVQPQLRRNSESQSLRQLLRPAG